MDGVAVPGDTTGPSAPTSGSERGGLIDRQAFFRAIRPLFGGRLDQSQVDGLDSLLDAWECWRDGQDLRWLAYCLATSFHETARTMQPIREIGGPAYFRRMYDPLSSDPRRAAMAVAMGCKPGDGAWCYGRGHVQLTWPPNYERAGREVGVDLIADPDRALEPEIAAEILFAGMRDGWFTGKRLSHYFNATTTDWLNARRIINGVDKAATIAAYAQSFHRALLA